MSGLRCWAALLGLLLFTQLAAAPVSVSDVRIATSGDRTRVVLELDQPAPHKLFTLSNPGRVVVDINSGRFSLGAAGIPGGAGAVANIRAANREDGSARLVLDLSRAAQPKSFLLEPGGGLGHRLVIDLHPASSASAGATTSSPPARAATVPVAPAPLRKTPAGSDRDIVVAIDPGHGGKDPGARGSGGLLEKDVVLQISRRLAQLINDEPGMRAYLTRNDDRFLSLAQRRQLAQNANADLFVSVHADAFSDRRVRGATVYILSEKGASDEAAALLAKRENDADLIGGVQLADKDEMVARVLVDLSQTASISSSVEVGDHLIAEIGRVTKVRKMRVQQAGFRVLKSPSIPSVLIETAYISNPQDESNLKSVQHQQRLAQALHRGIRSYFYTNPPTGTRIASLSRNSQLAREHVIQRGDTLSGIAQRYQVTVSSLRTANSLADSRIRVGQVLRIPSPIET